MAAVVAGAALVAATALVPWGGRAHAGEFVRMGESARGLGMGGAMTAVATSFDAMLYNPAGLALTNYWKVEARYWEEESTTEKAPRGGDFFAAFDGLPGQSETDVDAFLGKQALKPLSTRTGQLLGYHNETGFGIAALDTIHRKVAPTGFDPDPGVTLGFDQVTQALLTYSFITDLRLMMWGFTLKAVERGAISRNLTGADIAAVDFEPEFVDSGEVEFDMDIGFMARLPIPFVRPTFGVAMLNLRAPDFGLPDVTPLQREINVGIAFNPPIFPDYMRTTIAADMRDMTRTGFADESRVKREHFGVELAFWQQDDDNWLLHVRYGKSQGRDSFGIGVNWLYFATLDYVQYFEDVGDDPYEAPQRRRMIELKLGF